MSEPFVSRRAALGGAAVAAGAALSPRVAEAAVPRTAFDPPGRSSWVTRAFDHDLRAGSPHFLAYSGVYPLTLGTTTSRTADGVVLTGSIARARIAGRFVPQAVSVSWYLLPQIHSMRVRRDPARTAVVRATAQEMYRTSGRDAAGAVWFPHSTPYHGGVLEQGLPWYSGMTQGMALSVYSTLWEVTGDRRWRIIADGVYRSFRHYRDLRADNRGRWFVGYEPFASGALGTIMEEYPSARGAKNAHVVNGYIYSLWGLFDYHRTTGNAEARVLLDRGLASLRGCFSRYRVPGGPSWYAMTPFGHDLWGRPIPYHYGTARILQRTGRITRDPEFVRQGDTLLRDHAGR